MNDSQLVLLADGGSTKVLWSLRCGGDELIRFATSGMNPTVTDIERLADIVNAELIPKIHNYHIDKIKFYGAGCCGSEATGMLRDVLLNAFGYQPELVIDSDMVGNAYSLFGEGSGIACILGTGSNSCVYESGKVVDQTPPLGYILGDEGSGAWLGRRLLGDVYKGVLPSLIIDRFKQSYPDLQYAEMLAGVYRPCTMPPNEFLASFAPFFSQNLECPEIAQIVREGFDLFFSRNIDRYGRHDLAVGFIGSIAHVFRGILTEVCATHGYALGKVLKHPF